MRPTLISFLAILVVTTAIVASSGVAMAAPPPNDTIDGATVISDIPFSDTIDTTEATTDADDAALNATCGAPATDASVWYTLTLDTDTLLLVDVTASDYFAGVIIATGEPGSLEFVTCGPDVVLFEALAGVQYYVLAFDDQFDGGGNGGTLVITAAEAPPPPDVELTVDPVASFDNRTGTATVSGTIVCEGDADFVGISGTMQQKVGRFVVNGFFSVEGFSCDGTVQEWTAEVTTDGSRFAGGKATVEAFAFACGFLFCDEDFVQQQVRLRR